MAAEAKSKSNSVIYITVFIINLAAFAAVIWIVVPAPSYYFWLFSVLASEWSVGFGIFAVFGIFCAIFSWLKIGGKVWIVPSLLAIAALIISLYPFFSSCQAAQTSVLSWREYFSGFGKQNREFSFSTRTFAKVDGNDLKVDIYLPPEGIEKNGAGIIVIHGGSWSGGNRNDLSEWNRWLSENGYTIFDIDYRLTQPNWQTATGDVKCAAGWVAQNATEFGIQPDKLVLMGRSAGAHLALLSAYSRGASQLPPSCAAENQNKIRAVISLYGPTDLIWDYDHPANQQVIDGPETLKRLMGGSPYDSAEMRNKYLTASPINYITVETPPTLLIQGGQDQLVLPQNMDLLGAKLKEKNVVNEEVFIPYAQHGFDFNFKGWGSQVSKPKILEFLHENTK